jgi:predicted DNA-binding transcriptional regulator AlpA
MSKQPNPFQSAARAIAATVPKELLTARQVCTTFGVSTAWVYKRTRRDAEDPLPVFRLSLRAVRFDPDKISSYLRSHERHRNSASLRSFEEIARVNGKVFTLTRKRFQIGSVQLRTDRGSDYWQGFYREDVLTEPGKTVRKRRAVNLGTLKKTPNENVAKQKLGTILNSINDAKRGPRKEMSFRGFIQLKYRPLKLANKKGTTVHGYETNIRAHYLPEFGDMQLSEISAEDVQVFLNQKSLEGKAVQTLKNLKWGLSSIFESAIKYGYIQQIPPPGPICLRRRSERPTASHRRSAHSVDRCARRAVQHAGLSVCSYFDPSGGGGVQVA